MFGYKGILLTVFVVIACSLGSYAKTSTSKSPNYTVRKDSLTDTSVDTNKRVILFPNPFSAIINHQEEKK